MSPSRGRRPGYSRRMQYETFLGYATGVAGAVIGLALLILSFVNPPLLAPVRNFAADVTAPFGKISSAVRTGVLDTGATIKGYTETSARTIKLEHDLRVARAQLAKLEAAKHENVRLKALLGLADKEPRPVVYARLISSTATSTRRYATVSAGSRQGVKAGMPVRSETGLIGRITEAGALTSRVLLITDGESLVPARRSTDGIPVIAQGLGNGLLQLRLVELGVNPLRKGDVFITSGSGGLYQPGIAVAVVAKITNDGAIARVFEDPATTDYVIVDPIWSGIDLPSPSPSVNQDGQKRTTAEPAPAQGSPQDNRP